MSVKLTTNLSQRLVLTPQLRQRIEMLQMTSLELGDLIQQQLLENPILEEVQQQDEKREIETAILDQLAGSGDESAAATSFEATQTDPLNGNALSPNGAGEMPSGEAAPEIFEGETVTAAAAEEFGEESDPVDRGEDAFEEIDFGREFQDYLDP